MAKARLRARRLQDDGRTAAALETPTGRPVFVVLNGSRDAIARVLELRLTPLVAQDEEGMVLRWWSPEPMPDYDEPGGFSDLFSDVAVSIYEGNRRAMTTDLERTGRAS